ncbi:MAG: hypothetical protein NTV06_00520 [candidate division Zixibacteria bacterium]|nr:hypothetical protein [candidate division Zixibacteria bacterium]
MLKLISSKRGMATILMIGILAALIMAVIVISGCSSKKTAEKQAIEGQAALPQDVGNKALLDTTSTQVEKRNIEIPPSPQTKEIAQKPVVREQPKPKPKTTEPAVVEKPTQPEIVKTLVLAENSALEVSLLTPLATGQNKAGDPFRALVKGPAVKGETLNLPEGTLLEGQISELNDGKAEGEKAFIKLRFTEIILPGEKPIPIEGYLITDDSTGVIRPGGQGKTIAKDAAIGAAAGGIIGAIAGGKVKDALKGAVAGGAAGGVLGAVLHQDQVTLKEGENLKVKIITPVYQEKIKKGI